MSRWLNNLGLTAIGHSFLYLLDRMMLVLAAWWVSSMGGGLLQALEAPFIVSLIATLLVIEFAGYLLHLLFHKVPALWRLHAIHHSDTGVDFTTTYRHHPVEIVLNSLLSLPFILILGPPALAVLAVEVFRTVMIYTGHANIYIPEPVDRFLRRFLVTPDFHRLHHCSERKHTDSNYSVMVPWFDYLFGTASQRPFKEQETMTLGLEYYRDARSSRLDRMLLLPFISRKREGSSPGDSQSEALSGAQAGRQA